MQYIVTLVRLSVFANVYTTLANNPCDRIAGIPYIDSALGWLTAIAYWFSLPCLFYTLVNALVPSNKREGDIAQSTYSAVTKGLNQSTIHSQSQLSSKQISRKSIPGKIDELMTFLSFSFTKAIVILEDIMGWFLKSYLVDLESMGSDVLPIVKVETSSQNGENMLSKGDGPFWEGTFGANGAELPWFKVLNVMQSMTGFLKFSQSVS